MRGSKYWVLCWSALPPSPPVKVYKYTSESICQSMCVFLWVLMHFLNCFKTCTLWWFIVFITDVVLTAASQFFQQGQGQNCMMQPLLPYLIVLSRLSLFLIGQMFLREPSWLLTGRTFLCRPSWKYLYSGSKSSAHHVLGTFALFDNHCLWLAESRALLWMN